MTIEMLSENLIKMSYGNKYIDMGVDRKVETLKKGDKTYLTIKCYTANGRYKGQYKCGYMTADGQYVTGPYDDVNAETMEYLK